MAAAEDKIIALAMQAHTSARAAVAAGDRALAKRFYEAAALIFDVAGDRWQSAIMADVAAACLGETA